MKNQRTCISCRKTKDKNELIRIVKNKQGEIKVSINGKEDGRGAYVCKDTTCIVKLQKSKGLNRAFKCEVPNSIYEELVGFVEK